MTIKNNLHPNKILFLLVSKKSPSSRYRAIQFFPFLERNSYICHYQTSSLRNKVGYLFFDKLFLFLYKLFIIITVPLFDIVVIQKPNFLISSWIFIWLFYLVKKKVIFDFDDAVFVNPKTNQLRDKIYLRKLSYIISHSDAVIAGNKYLSEYAQQFNSNVHIISTVINTQKEPLCIQKSKQENRFTIGWIGTKENLSNIDIVCNALTRICDKYKDIKIVVISDSEKKDMRSLPVTFIPWHEKNEDNQIRDFSIGIMPLKKNELYSHYKCGFKLLQYMSQEVPIIASPVGINSDIVQQSGAGFLADGDEEWFTCLEKMYHLSIEERISLGKKGKVFIDKNYSVTSALPKLIKIFNELI